jgi:hypothetical protein
VATIRITRYEVRNNLLPSVCMVTGEPTGDTKRHTFRWTPPWVGVLILGGLLPYIVVAMILRKEITIEVPLASRKRGHWLVRQLFALFGVFGCIALAIAGIVISADLNNGRNQGPDFGLMLTAAAGVGLVLVIIVALILQSTCVRPKEITDRDITLSGVHENFVVAMEEERDRNEEEEEEERDRKRARRHSERETPRRDRRDRDEDAPRARRIRDDD